MMFSARRLLLLSGSALLLAGGPALSQTPPAPEPAPAATPTPAAPAAAAPVPAAPTPATPTPAAPAAAAPAPASAPARAAGSTVLPEIDITAPRQGQATRKPKKPVVTTARRDTPAALPQTASQVVAGKNDKLDDARGRILATGAASTTSFSQQSIEALPQGTNASVDKVLLQAPGVTQDSAASGDLHVRNEHANVQYRINGIMLPDGVGAFGQILDTGIIGNLNLLTGALPAQYGLRTAGVIDITTKADAFNNSGSISLYGGSHGTISPSFEYGGTVGQTQYFVSGKFFGSNLGLENPTPGNEAIHDRTAQEKGFLYLSTVIDPNTRLTLISGVSNSSFQIPNNPGQPSNNTAFGVSSFDSSQLNEHQNEFNQFNVVAYQKSIDGLDYQLSYFNRTSTLHFIPDTIGDLVINGVASDVYRQSITNGIQEDTSYKLNDTHTLRFGFSTSAEQAYVSNTSTLLPIDPTTGSSVDAPFTVQDNSAKTGWLFSTYAQDEWKLTNTLTLNTGLRFDQMLAYVDANQLSPRASVTWKPFDGTTFHAGYARNFEPPPLVLAAPTNLALVQGTTQQPAVSANDPVQPERSNVYDIGVDQKVLPGLMVGVDAYYKTARDLLDDGQFGAAYVLTAFNYDHATNVGVELKANYSNGNFSAYGNIAWAKQTASNVVSNQYLFDPDELAYIATHDVFTDHAQLWTGSAGASYLWDGTRYSVSMIYGSGLRDGFANTDTVPSYTQVNLGLSHDFLLGGSTKPTTVRFDVVNLFDKIYEIRDGSGIGVFAPQFGPRRGFYLGISQKL
jgi:outer membrane receptor protein involved in Fe transport